MIWSVREEKMRELWVVTYRWMGQRGLGLAGENGMHYNHVTPGIVDNITSILTLVFTEAALNLLPLKLPSPPTSRMLEETNAYQIDRSPECTWDQDHQQCAQPRAVR